MNLQNAKRTLSLLLLASPLLVALPAKAHHPVRERVVVIERERPSILGEVLRNGFLDCDYRDGCRYGIRGGGYRYPRYRRRYNNRCGYPTGYEGCYHKEPLTGPQEDLRQREGKPTPITGDEHLDAIARRLGTLHDSFYGTSYGGRLLEW
jgi:hypothetical protein